MAIRSLRIWSATSTSSRLSAHFSDAQGNAARAIDLIQVMKFLLVVPSADIPLQFYILAHVAAVGLVDLVDQFVGDLFLRDAHHEPQV